MFQGVVAGLEAALSIATTGYQTDQTRIDTEIQKAKDDVAQQIVDLTTRAETAEASVATLTQTNTDLQAQIGVQTTPVDTLPAQSIQP